MSKRLSFPDLVASQTDYVRWSLRRYTQDDALIKDIVQDALIRALANEDKFDGNNIKGWLAMIARNLYANYYRLNKHKWNTIPANDLSYDLQCVYAYELPAVTTSLSNQELQHAIDLLPVKQATAQRLRLSGMSYDEVASEMRIPLSNVRGLLYEAKRKLPELFSRMSPLTAYDMNDELPAKMRIKGPNLADEDLTQAITGIEEVIQIASPNGKRILHKLLYSLKYRIEDIP